MAEMMTVGGISVPITGDTAPLEKKLNDVEKQSGDSGKKAGDAFAGRYAEGFRKLSASITVAIGAIVFAVKKLNDQMDQVGKQAQALGVTTEAMSRLQYAAQVSGASVQDLNTAMISLSRRMGERDQLSEGVRLFDALGISVTNAAGRMKSADQIMVDLATKFERMEDGAGKTEIAVRLFGESGARLIPLLNGGAAGMAELFEQSDKLGNTLNDKTAKAAAEFNDSITRITVSLQSWGRGLVADVLPALTYLANDLANQSREVAETDKKWSAFNITLKTLISTGVAIQSTFSAVGSVVGGVVAALIKLTTLDLSGAAESIKQGLTDAFLAMERGQKNIAVVWSTWTTEVEFAAERTGAAFKKVKAPVVKTSEEITKALNAIRLSNQYMFQDLMQSDFTPYEEKLQRLEEMARKGAIPFRDFVTATRDLKRERGAEALKEIMETDTKPFADRIRELNALVENGSIKWADYKAASRQVTEGEKAAMNDLASTTSQALTTIFEDNKKAAIAGAIINTLQGITKALSQYPPPYSFAMAALQGAMGFAQVAKIRSTSKESTGTPSTSVPAVSAAAPTQAATSGAEAPGLNQTLTIQGIHPDEMFSGRSVRTLAKKLVDFQRDGGKVVFV